MVTERLEELASEHWHRHPEHAIQCNGSEHTREYVCDNVEVIVFEDNYRFHKDGIGSELVNAHSIHIRDHEHIVQMMATPEKTDKVIDQLVDEGVLELNWEGSASEHVNKD